MTRTLDKRGPTIADIEALDAWARAVVRLYDEAGPCGDANVVSQYRHALMRERLDRLVSEKTLAAWWRHEEARIRNAGLALLGDVESAIAQYSARWPSLDFRRAREELDRLVAEEARL